MMKREELLREIDTRRALFGTFFAFNNRLQVAGDAFYDEITCKQFFLLICLSLFTETPPTINELSEVMGSSHQNVKQIVNKLENNGFLITQVDDKDRRKIRVMPTEKVQQFSEKYRNREMQFMDRFYDGLSEEEISGALRTMTQLEKNLLKIKEELS